ncbi:hypothetical protein ACHAW5_006456 [Stephanodiscus triporus]|uniref:Uncharacterized protein n=1 Tax=Stephanodiscus triporus TaxID=2934178 RepID=A0ABD3NE95_9STRA
MPPPFKEITLLSFFSDGLKERIARDRRERMEGLHTRGGKPAGDHMKRRSELLQLKKEETVNFIERNKLPNGLGDSLIKLITVDDGKCGGIPLEGVWESSKTAETRSELVTKMNDPTLCDSTRVRIRMKYWKDVSVDKSYLSKNGLNTENEGVIEYISMLEEEAGVELAKAKSNRKSNSNRAEKRDNERAEVVTSIDEGKNMLPNLAVNQQTPFLSNLSVDIGDILSGGGGSDDILELVQQSKSGKEAERESLLVIIMGRISPYTLNSGNKQLLLNLSSVHHLRENGCLGEDDEIEIHGFIGYHESGHSMLRSTALHSALAMIVTNRNRPVKVVVSDILRLGRSYEQCAAVFTLFEKLHDNIEIVSCVEYGVDIYKVAKAIESSRVQHKMIDAVSTSKNPSKSITADDDSTEIQDEIITMSNKYQRKWNNDYPADVKEGIRLGKEMNQGETFILRDMMKNVSNGKTSIDDAVRGLLTAYSGSIPSHDALDILYVRCSGGCKRLHEHQGRQAHHIGMSQISKCYAARDALSKRVEKETSNLCIITDIDKDKNCVNPGLIEMMLRVLKQNVSIVVANSTNRISSYANIIMMLQGICKAKGTTLLFASECGKIILDVAEAERIRFLEKTNVTRLYNETIENLVKELNGNKKGLHDRLKLIDTVLRGEAMVTGKSAKKARSHA